MKDCTHLIRRLIRNAVPHLKENFLFETLFLRQISLGTLICDSQQ
uniref:Uncharacterized protein n=1 Tax=Anguilla anguilla TaxID=7936 RepID=A0A0E9SEI3_ANGAN